MGYRMKGFSGYGNSPVKQATYVKRDQPSDVRPTVVTSDRLEAIKSRLNTLNTTDTKGWNRGKLQSHSENLKRGRNARSKEIKRIVSTRKESGENKSSE